MTSSYKEKLVVNASKIKRFVEIWRGDAVFRQELKLDPQETVSKYNLDLDPLEIRIIWDEQFCSSESETSPLIADFQKFSEVFTPARVRQELLHQAHDIRFQAWRKRQMARIESLLEPEVSVLERSYPFSVELSEGCSVGCWFCGVSAPRLQDLFLYTEQNRQLWRDTLSLMKRVMGDLAGAGFCYHATEPLDNPDYEKFCLDFYDILGVFPQTTTAQALKNPFRTRQFLKLAEEKGQLHNRFSILSLKMLSEIHQKFTARELAFTGLEFRHREIEAERPKVFAGRARERQSDVSESELDLASGSITTTVGFLFNMVQKTIQLISPCIANERWKDGYRIHETRNFTDVDDLEIVIEELIDYHMPLELLPTDKIGFRPELEFSSLETGFQVGTKYKTYKFTNSAYASLLGSLVARGNLTTQEIQHELTANGVPAEAALQALNFLAENGILDDEPTFR